MHLHVHMLPPKVAVTRRLIASMWTRGCFIQLILTVMDIEDREDHAFEDSRMHECERTCMHAVSTANIYAVSTANACNARARVFCRILNARSDSDEI